MFVLNQTNAQQNLVLNPSFEQTNGILNCAYYQSNYFPVVDWETVALTSPDLITNTLNAGCVTSSLHASSALEPPFAGNNYIALLNYQPNQYLDRFYREYIRGKLSQPLQPGIPYKIVFNVCLGIRSNVGMNKLGIKFINNTSVISVTPGEQIVFLDADVISSASISNLNNWGQITLNYTPTDTNLNAFFIGIFSDDPHISNLPATPINSVYASYILIDDIKVYSNFLPEFDLQNIICKGAPLTLPTVSTNGISGTWSPAPNNQQTTTYVFTPNNPIYGTYTKTIVVANQMLPTFTQVSYSCEVAEIDGLPTISNNGLEGVWTPEFNPFQTTTYTFTPNLPCALNTQMTVRIGITPEFTQVGPFCEEATISSLPTVSNNGVTGTWSPAFDPTQTRNYSFMPSTNLCPVGMRVVIEQVPIFNQIEPFCEPDLNFSLPTISDNGVSGTWSPTFNPYETTTYTFVSDASCGLTTEMTIIISEKAEFTPLGPFCEMAEIESLPTTSNNGIEGTWSPVFNPYQTDIYTFTPNEEFCSEIVTMEVTIDKIPTFDVIEPFCEPDLNFSLPSVSTNGISGTWSPEFDPYNSQTYTFTRNSGVCSQQVTLDVVVYPPLKFDFNFYCDDAHYFIELIANNFSLTDISDIKWLINNNSISESGNKINLSDYSNVLQEVNTIEVIFTDSNNCLHSKEIQVYGKDFCKIQKGISPNGDGFNEYFDLATYGGVDLKIFNRYGSVVYEKSNYKNEWHGQSKDGKNLPSGTYFYQIQTNIGEQFTGYIQLTY